MKYPKDLNSEKEKILQVLRNSESFLKDFRERVSGKNVIIYFGNSRNGKSTLVNFIVETELEAFIESNNYKIRCCQNYENYRSSIGQGTLSHTSVPVIIEIDDDTVIVDPPGFEDNRSSTQEVTNALYINQIKYARTLKVVLVSDICNIESDDIGSFTSFIHTVHSIMPNVEDLKECVSIIFTKDKKQYTRCMLAELFKIKIIDVKQLQMRKELPNHFFANKTSIGSFRMPTHEGKLTEEVDYHIKDAIGASHPVNVSGIRFGLSDKTRVVLLDTYVEFYDIVQYFKQLFDKTKDSFLEGLGLLNLQLKTDDELYTIEVIHQTFQSNAVNYEVKKPYSKTIPENIIQVCSNYNGVIGQLIDYDFDVPSLTTKDQMDDNLSYIECIENIIETSQKSDNICEKFKECVSFMISAVDGLINKINRERHDRAELKKQANVLLEIRKVLHFLNDDYLSASTNTELLQMHQKLHAYSRSVLFVINEITTRPSLKTLPTDDLHALRQNLLKYEENINRSISKRKISLNQFKPVITIICLIELAIMFGCSRLENYMLFYYSLVPCGAVIFKSSYFKMCAKKYWLRCQQSRFGKPTIIDTFFSWINLQT